jgi:hypothetical protein
MKVGKANQILKRAVGSERWYFEKRGYKIWFLEQLVNTFNRIFPLTLPSGQLADEIYDWHVHRAIQFVQRARLKNWRRREIFDVKRAVASGETFDD